MISNKSRLFTESVIREMTRLCIAEHGDGCLNLAQGFPDFACDPRIVDAVSNAMRDGHNQYPPMAGAASLRHAISEKVERLYGRQYDAEREITVTAGASARST